MFHIKQGVASNTLYQVLSFFFFFFETCHSLIVSLDILYFSFLGEIEYLRVPLESLSYQQVYSEDNKCSIVLHSSRKRVRFIVIVF